MEGQADKPIVTIGITQNKELRPQLHREVSVKELLDCARLLEGFALNLKVTQKEQG